MYYNLPASCCGGELPCPGCELCCDIVYCGELKFTPDYAVSVKYNSKETGVSYEASKIGKAMKDVQKRALDLQRKVALMERQKQNPTSSKRKVKARLSKLRKTDHGTRRYCSDYSGHCIWEDSLSKPIKARVNDKRGMVLKNVDVSRMELEYESSGRETETPVNPTKKKKSTTGFEDFYEKDETSETKRGSFFGGSAPPGLTCGFRYERERDDGGFTSSDVYQGRKCLDRTSEARDGRGCGSSGRRLTGVPVSFEDGSRFPREKFVRRTWCCCPWGM